MRSAPVRIVVSVDIDCMGDMLLRLWPLQKDAPLA